MFCIEGEGILAAAAVAASENDIGLGYLSYPIGLSSNAVGYDVERVKALEPLANFPLG